MEIQKETEVIKDYRFSPDGSFIDIGTSVGFRIYSTDPKVQVQNEKVREEGNIKLVQSTNNLVVYVRDDGAGPAQQLYIYDDYHNRDASKIVFKSEIKEIKLTQTCLLVILEKKAYLFDLNLKDEVYKEPQLKMKFDTVQNNSGIGCLYSTGVVDIAILPGKVQTSVQIYDSSKDQTPEIELEEKVAFLAVHGEGGVFAHTNEHGSKIKLRNISDGSIAHVYNRGKDYVEIASIAFDQLCSRMVVASKKQTIHVFALPKDLSEKAINYLKDVGTSENQSEVSDSTIGTNPSLLESRHGGGPGFFGRLIGGEGETSYLKVYVDHPDKICTIFKNNLVILTSEGIVHYIDIQSEGRYYLSSEGVTTVDLLKTEDKEEGQE